MEQINLRAYEALVLKQIQSGETVQSIFLQSPVSAEETARAIIGYLSIGIVEFVDAPESGLVKQREDDSVDDVEPSDVDRDDRLDVEGGAARPMFD